MDTSSSSSTSRIVTSWDDIDAVLRDAAFINSLLYDGEEDNESIDGLFNRLMGMQDMQDTQDAQDKHQQRSKNNVQWSSSSSSVRTVM